jgi:hypothetical protein
VQPTAQATECSLKASGKLCLSVGSDLCSAFTLEQRQLRERGRPARKL